MVKPDDDTTTALAQLSRTAQWGQIEAWLVKCREACVQESLSAEPTRSRQAQGKLLAIDEIIKATRSAESVPRR